MASLSFSHNSLDLIHHKLLFPYEVTVLFTANYFLARLALLNFLQNATGLTPKDLSKGP